MPPKLSTTVFMDRTDLAVQHQLTALQGSRALEVSYISLPQLTAQAIVGWDEFRQLFRGGDTPHVLLLGYETCGTELLEELARLRDRLPASSERLLVTVVAPGATRAVAADLANFPYLGHKLDLAGFDCAWADETGLGEQLRKAAARGPVSVGVILESEVESLNVAVRLLAHWATATAFPTVCLLSPDIIDGMTAGEVSQFLSFDLQSRVLTAENIAMDDVPEAAARHLAERWAAGERERAGKAAPPRKKPLLRRLFGRRPPPSLYPRPVPWDELSAAERDFWRDRADCFPSRLVRGHELTRGAAARHVRWHLRRRRNAVVPTPLDPPARAALARACPPAGREWDDLTPTERRQLEAEVGCWPAVLLDLGFETVEQPGLR